MRIAVISGTAYPASPDFYGSEVMLAVLADALGKMGNEVTLYAASKSMKGSYRLRLLPCTWGMLSYVVESCVDVYMDEIMEHDYIIDGSGLTMVCENIWFWHRDWLKEHAIVYYRNGYSSFNPRPPVNYNIHGVWLSKLAVSSMEPFKLPPEVTHVIPYGVPDWYKPVSEPTMDYWLYLGRPHPHKGVDIVLDLAKELPNERFVFAWNAIFEEHKRYEEKYLQEIDRLPNCEFIKVRNLRRKVELLANAKALIVPLGKDYVEAYGLVGHEALACGTPIIYGARSGIWEVAEEGKHGFKVESKEDVIKAMKSIDSISREACLEFARNNGPELMAKRFLELYEEVRK